MLNITEKKSNSFLHKIQEGEELFKPGYTRFNIPFYFEEEKINFVLDAIEFVANEGYKLMVDYHFNSENGSWVHSHPISLKTEKSFGFRFPSSIGSHTTASNESTYLSDASLILNETINKFKLTRTPLHCCSDSVDHDQLRWFVLPHEIHQEILESQTKLTSNL